MALTAPVAPPGLLAPALNCAVRGWLLAKLHITGPGDNGGYRDVSCAVLPPLTDSEIIPVATVLRFSAGVFDDVPE